MNESVNCIELKLLYTNHSGDETQLVVGIKDDLKLSHERLEGIFLSAFHASNYGLPSPAKVLYDWQADGEDHATVKITSVELTERCFANAWIEEWAEEPISVIAEKIKQGGCPKFQLQSENALKSEHKRLSELLGKDRQALVITVGYDGKVESLITESDDIEYSCIVLDKNAEGIAEDIACDWHGDRAWVYEFPSYSRADSVFHARVVSHLTKNYDPLTRFKDIDGCVEVACSKSEYIERVRYPAGMSQESVERMIDHLNVTDW